MKLGKHEIHPWHFLKVCALTVLFVWLVIVAAVAEVVADFLKEFSECIWRAAESIDV